MTDHDELREKVARALETWASDGFFRQADAAVAVVLEEAVDAVGTVGDHADAGAYITAIRDLIPKEKQDADKA
jgi:hypothetical protein